jgi:hypothetical protein
MEQEASLTNPKKVLVMDAQGSIVVRVARIQGAEGSRVREKNNRLNPRTHEL